MGPEAVDKFRRYLLHGNKTEGLEHAMRAGLWGHALFLASKMDGRTYAGVMTRFANGLAATDPLQILYQLMSAHLPSAMKQCGQARWGDWRPHLAMILSINQGGETNIRSIITPCSPKVSCSLHISATSSPASNGGSSETPVLSAKVGIFMS